MGFSAPRWVNGSGRPHPAMARWRPVSGPAPALCYQFHHWRLI